MFDCSTRITSVISPTCAIATGYDPWKSAAQRANMTPAASNTQMSTRWVYTVELFIYTQSSTYNTDIILLVFGLMPNSIVVRSQSRMVMNHLILLILDRRSYFFYQDDDFNP